MLLELIPQIIKCAPQIAPTTMLAIIQTESKGNRLAIGLNHGKKLRYHAKSLSQAQAWVDYLEQYSYDFDIGLTQINIKNVHKLGYMGRDVLDTCINLRISSYILYNNYQKALHITHNNKQKALFMTLSAYNTGNFYKGFNNGYVHKVVVNAQTIQIP